MPAIDALLASDAIIIDIFDACFFLP